MASIKNLKKHITGVCEELYADCLLLKLFSETMDPEKADAILSEIIRTEDDFLKRTGHPDGKNNRKLIKAYYKKISSDFDEKTNLLIQEIQALAK